MNIEFSGSLDGLSKQNQKSKLEKQLDFQEAIRPDISEEYYTSVVDFMAHLYNIESLYSGRNYEAFPKEFRDDITKTHNNTIFGNGSIKVAVMKLQHLEKDYKYNMENDQMSEILKKLTKDLKDKFDLATAYEYSKDQENGWVKDSYIACFPGKVVKNEKGEWTTEEKDGATAKFFALLVARGLIEEKVVLENNMANLGVRGIKFREDFLQTLSELKKENLEKIVEEPLHKF